MPHRLADMTPIERLYAPIRHLSVDVALGSAITSRFLMQTVAFRVPLSHHSLLAMAVWLIYALDHLMDSHRVQQSYAAMPNRHTFFRQHRRRIRPAMAIVATLLTVGLVRFRFPMWPNVLIAGLPTLAYLVVDKWVHFRTPVPKSCCIACGFTLGLAVFHLDKRAFWMTAWPHLTALFFLALYNIWIFQRQDAAYDVRILKENVRLHAMLRSGTWRKLPLLLMVLTLVMFVPQLSFILMLGLMGLVLLTCDLFSRRLARHERYRILGDGVFLLPLLALF